MTQEDDNVRFTGSKGIESEDRHQVNLFYDDAYDWGSIKILGGYGRTISRVGRNSFDASDIEKTDHLIGQIEGFLNYRALDNLNLTFGAGGRFEDIDISTFDRERFPKAQQRDVAHVLGQAEWEIINDVNLLAGVRYDNFSDFGDTVNPRASISWSPGDFNLRFGYGKAFKAPNFTAMFPTFFRNSSTGGPTRSFVIRGNPDLQPEKSETIELGGKYNFDYDWFFGSFETVGHMTWYNNLIQSVTTNTEFIREPPPGILIFTNDWLNVGRARIRGVEVAFNFGIKDYWTLWSSYEYLDDKNTELNTRLLGNARHVFRFQNAFYLTPQVTFNVNGRIFQGIRGTNEFRAIEEVNHYEFDMKLDYQPVNWLNLYAGIDNFIDEKLPFTAGSQGSPNDPGSRFYYLGFNARY